MKKDLKAIFGTAHGLDEKSIEFLTNALEKNNLPGFDYIEFKLALANMASMNLDEETSFKTAFATASTMGLTKIKLLETAGHYQKIINKERSQFELALQKRMQQRVAGKQSEVEKLKAQIIKHREKITQLEAQIDKYQMTIDNADATINEEKSKIVGTKENFETTSQSILNQIGKDIENIGRYL